MENNSEIFKKGLKENKKELIDIVEKSDLHCHAELSADKKVFEEKYSVKIPDPKNLKSIEEMDIWLRDYLKPYITGYDGMIMKYSSMFKNAEEQNIKVITPGFCLKKLKYVDGDIDEFIRIIKELKEKYAPNVNFIPELQLNRNNDYEYNRRMFEMAKKSGFFKSIDIMGKEEYGVDQFIDIYKEASELGWILKAHVGEFESAKFVEDALEKLNLDAINHGLSAKDSENLMKYIRDNNIMINCCPSSNLILSRIDGYSSHPIKTFVENGITCSVNTDDLMIFNQRLSEEYLNLYNNGTLGLEELDKVRQDGLNKCLCKRRGN